MLIEKVYGSGILEIVEDRDFEAVENWHYEHEIPTKDSNKTRKKPCNYSKYRIREARSRRRRIEKTRRWINRRMREASRRDDLSSYFYSIYSDEPNRFNKNRRYMRKCCPGDKW